MLNEIREYEEYTNLLYPVDESPRSRNDNISGRLGYSRISKNFSGIDRALRIVARSQIPNESNKTADNMEDVLKNWCDKNFENYLTALINKYAEKINKLKCFEDSLVGYWEKHIRESTISNNQTGKLKSNEKFLNEYWEIFNNDCGNEMIALCRKSKDEMFSKSFAQAFISLMKPNSDISVKILTGYAQLRIFCDNSKGTVSFKDIVDRDISGLCSSSDNTYVLNCTIRDNANVHKEDDDNIFLLYWLIDKQFCVDRLAQTKKSWTKIKKTFNASGYDFYKGKNSIKKITYMDIIASAWDDGPLEKYALIEKKSLEGFSKIECLFEKKKKLLNIMRGLIGYYLLERKRMNEEQNYIVINHADLSNWLRCGNIEKYINDLKTSNSPETKAGCENIKTLIYKQLVSNNTVKIRVNPWILKFYSIKLYKEESELKLDENTNIYIDNGAMDGALTLFLGGKQ